MTLTISIKQEPENKNVTIMVDDEQKISGTIQVLTQAGIIKNQKYNTVQSYRSRERIRVEKTYKEGHIYNGDILILK